MYISDNLFQSPFFSNKLFLVCNNVGYEENTYIYTLSCFELNVVMQVSSKKQKRVLTVTTSSTINSVYV